MIATRVRPKRKFNPIRLILPLVAIAALTFALVWGPSQRLIGNFIINGPLAPVWRIGNAIITPVVVPLHFASQEQVIADRNKALENLNGQLEDERKQIADRDQQIGALQNQVKAQQAAALRAQATPTPSAAPVVLPAAGSVAAAIPVAMTPSTSDPKRAASVWAAMEPAQAAAVAQKLPPSYTAKVMALMDPDSAGSLLGALPTDYAAKVQQAGPQPTP